ncbi:MULTISPECIES: VCBS repeat-containing protein [unclassified Streptomyces]|uniref:FG-GAP repeat domain-containing protein n=1 Tax=unclassified Streptomyces TaxID=2593676 RepID=UPI002035A95C|nr:MULTISPECIES: VCBS repeat-containing protein [unclassified Streptomyces]
MSPDMYARTYPEHQCPGDPPDRNANTPTPTACATPPRTTNDHGRRTRARAHTHHVPERHGNSDDHHHQGRGRPRRRLRGSAAGAHGLRQLLGRRAVPLRRRRQERRRRTGPRHFPPGAARAGQEWPEHPVCGDFDGDGSTDLAVTASDGRISFLRGPFARTGAPAGAELLPDGGPYLDAPEPRADTDGDGYGDLATARPRTPGKGARGTLLLGSADGPARPLFLP